MTSRSSENPKEYPLICISDFIHKVGRPAIVCLSPVKLVGNVLLTLPRFSTPKIMLVRPDIQFIDEDQPPTMYDLTIGLVMLANWKSIPNFNDKIVTIDHVKFSMQSLQSLCTQTMLNNLYRKATEPVISRVAINQVTQILDANYEKVDLPKGVDDHCRHLNVQQRNDLLQLLIQHEELFDGTLGD